MKNLIKKLENVNINQKVKVFNYIFDDDYQIIKENDKYGGNAEIIIKNKN